MPEFSKPGQSAGDFKAALYRRTAQALRLEAETAKPHCNVCFEEIENPYTHFRGCRGQKELKS